MYQLTAHGAIIRLADRTSFLADPQNVDYQRYLADLERGAIVLDPPVEPTPGPSRDERLLGAVDQAKSAVAKSGAFTPQQATVLSQVFDGLGKAITGGDA